MKLLKNNNKMLIVSNGLLPADLFLFDIFVTWLWILILEEETDDDHEDAEWWQWRPWKWW